MRAASESLRIGMRTVLSGGTSRCKTIPSSLDASASRRSRWPPEVCIRSRTSRATPWKPWPDVLKVMMTVMPAVHQPTYMDSQNS